MNPTRIVRYTYNDSKHHNFNYTDFATTPTPRTPGAFRVIKVKPLLTAPQEIQVYEYSNIQWGAGGGYRNLLAAAKSYVAISHVWSHADDVDAKLNKSTALKQFDIDVDPGEGGINFKRLGWVGLEQIAQAADKYDFKYLWLDFFCIDQIAKNNDNEMGLQICIMSDIYTYAKWVMVMIGGMGAVVKADDVTGWMDRAWTLQEAVVNTEVWVLLLWDNGPGKLTVTYKGSTYKFFSIGPSYKPNLDICIIKLTDLLDLADAGVKGITTIKVVDGAFGTPGDVARRALRMALARGNSQIQYTGVWRSMYLRTSSKPVDVVYSIMGIFRLQIDPFRKNRDPNFVFNDLARKVSVKSGLGPAWLTIGGVTGSDIPRDPTSRLVFKFPHPEAAGKPSKNTPPEMMFMSSGSKEWAGYHVDDSEWYIKRYNMRVMSQSHPHIINAVMLSVGDPQMPIRNRKVPRVTPSGSTLPSRNYILRSYAKVRISSFTNTLVWYGDLSNAASRKIKAVFVGEVGDVTAEPGGPPLNLSNESTISKSPVDYRGMSFFLFVEFTRKRSWHVVADGVFATSASKFINKGRSIFTIGRGSQKTWSAWPTASQTKFNHRSRYFHHSYGVQPLSDWRVPTGREQQQVIQWFGYKHETPYRGIPWVTQSLAYNIWDLLKDPKWTKLNSKLTDTHPLSVVSTSAFWNEIPSTATTQTTWRIRENGAAEIPFSYGGWTRSQCSDLARAGVDGVLLHDPNTGPSDVQYQIRVSFGERVMYVHFKQDVETKSQWSQIYVVPYRSRNDNLLVINSASIISNLPPKPSPCAPVTELGLPLGASNRDVGEAIARVLMQEFGLPYDQAQYKAMYMWGTNLSGLADVRAMELRKRYCFRGLDPANYGGHPQDFLPW
ncbi:hypothetical protein F5Y04DRAFT_80278 [Hypomontagnella monticulosa]|nr:hypothetical protein F5Y04DRAFT_80278 [Hypomontagnella monticulosa]